MELGTSRRLKGGEQRRTRRFPVECELAYKALGKVDGRIVGAGHTINMSSGGVLFTAEHSLDVGQQVELSIKWPTKLEGKHPLNLIVVGRVVRSEVGKVAVETRFHDFRMRGSADMRLLARSVTNRPGMPRAGRKAS